MIVKKTNLVKRLLDNINFWYSSGEIRTGIPTVIQPTIDITTFGKTNILKYVQSVGSTGFETVISVPDNEWWTIHNIYCFVSSGVWTMAGIAVYINDERLSFDTNEDRDPKNWTPDKTPYGLVAKTSGASFIAWEPNWRFRVPPRTIMKAWVDSWTSSGALVSTSLVTREIYD